jgi:hypothetical protein
VKVTDLLQIFTSHSATFHQVIKPRENPEYGLARMKDDLGAGVSIDRINQVWAWHCWPDPSFLDYGCINLLGQPWHLAACAGW